MSITPRDELYVTLPSNVPGFSTNKPEEYTTTLPTPLVLSGNWEVALLETHYFNDWVNFPETNMAILLKAKKVDLDDRGLYSPQSQRGEASEPRGEPKQLTVTPLNVVTTGSLAEANKMIINVIDDDDAELNSEQSGVVVGETPEEPKQVALDLVDGDELNSGQRQRREAAGDAPNDAEETAKQLAAFAKLRDEPCPLKTQVKLPRTITEAEVKADSFYGKLYGFLREHGGIYGEELIPVKIPRAHYDHISQIGELIVKRVESSQQMKANYSDITGKFEFSNKTYELIFAAAEPYLFERLGYIATPKMIGDTTFYIAKVNREGDRRATLIDINTIFVYSDIVDYQIVGNTKATLMGVFPTTGKHYEQQSWQFNPFQYMSVQNEEIRSITMALRTPMGDPVPFLSGDSLCRLHFRRKLL